MGMGKGKKKKEMYKYNMQNRIECRRVSATAHLHIAAQTA